MSHIFESKSENRFLLEWNMELQSHELYSATNVSSPRWVTFVGSRIYLHLIDIGKYLCGTSDTTLILWAVFMKINMCNIKFYLVNLAFLLNELWAHFHLWLK